MYCGYITTINEIRKHSNADRLQCATVFGCNVIVDLSYHVGQKVVFFPVDGQLSEEFCNENNLVRRKDENGKNIGGYLDPNKRNITAIRLRGEKSEGLVLPYQCLVKYVGDAILLPDGSKIDIIGGHEICRKYIPKTNTPRSSRHANPKKKSDTSYPFFAEHKDTEQLKFNLDAFKPGDTCYITLKMHGTSARTSNALCVKRKSGLIRRLFHLPDKESSVHKVVSGTRRTVINTENDNGGYYGTHEFRMPYHRQFAEVLPKGMTVYYEIVGYVNEATTIMGNADNKKVNDKEFVRKYGDTTVFSYGCNPGENDIYVYRITMTNDDGYVVELPWEQVKIECERMGVKHVPEFDKFLFTTKEDLMSRVESFYGGEDPIGKTHVREGVVVRIDNRESFKAYKHKNFEFLCIEGIVKDTADAPDMEEAEELLDAE